MTKTEAYEAGLNGLDAPAVKTKRVRSHDPIAGWKDGEAVWVTYDVETDASMSLRHAWQKGRKLRELREYVAARQNAQHQIASGELLPRSQWDRY